jgi:DNA-binding MarR family transcriptional regulator
MSDVPFGGDERELSPAVVAARDQMQNPRQLSDRIAMGRALWRDLVVGFAAQLSELGLGFAQLAALYAIDGAATLTVADLAEDIGRSPSATSRLVTSLE